MIKNVGKHWNSFSLNKSQFGFFFLDFIYFRILFYLDTEYDLITTTISPLIANVCENQTISSSDEIENRINVVVPYLVVLGEGVRIK